MVMSITQTIHKFCSICIQTELSHIDQNNLKRKLHPTYLNVCGACPVGVRGVLGSLLCRDGPILLPGVPGPDPKPLVGVTLPGLWDEEYSEVGVVGLEKMKQTE